MIDIRRFIGLGLILLFVSCTSREGEQKTGILSYLINITENENLGIQDVLGFYGGKCEYAVGKSYSTKERNKNYFELKLTESDALEKYLHRPGIPASNMAYRFYRNLNDSERKQYTHIKTIIVFPGGQASEMEFSTFELEIIDSKIQLVDRVVALISEKKFDDLAPLLKDTSEFVSYNKYELINTLREVDAQFGNVMEEGFRMFGYSINPLDKKGNDILHYYGAIIRDKQSNAFTISIDPYSPNDMVYLLQYEM